MFPLGALLLFVVVWWFILAKCTAWIFTACFLHGHLSTQAVCLQMPALAVGKSYRKEQMCQDMLCADETRQPNASLASSWLFFCSESFFVVSGFPEVSNLKWVCSLLTCC